MSLITGALLTVAELLQYLKKSDNDALLPYFSIYNNATGATAATVSKVGVTLTLIVTGGASAGTVTKTLTDAANDTISEIVAVINALAGAGSGWVANVLNNSDSCSSSDIWNFGTTGCLTINNEIDIDGKNTAYYESIINAASQQIMNYCGRVFTVDLVDITYYLDTNYNKFLFLDKYPIVSITSIDYWDPVSAATAGSLTEGTDYIRTTVYDEAGMIENADNWGVGVKSIRLIGKLGFTTLPEDLKMACKELCEYIMMSSPGLKSERIGTYSYDKQDNTENGGIPDTIQSKLYCYVKQGNNIR